ncbi:MAG: hypothetical protein GY757_16835 [bacterium]|nr:hypothetical protein [bacterium]
MYFIGVDDWKYDDWEFTGIDTMYRFYEENPKEAKKEGYDLDENGDVKNLDRLADKHAPMMSLAYPLHGEPDEEKIIDLCKRTECTVVKKNDSEDLTQRYLISKSLLPTCTRSRWG